MAMIASRSARQHPTPGDIDGAHRDPQVPRDRLGRLVLDGRLPEGLPGRGLEGAADPAGGPGEEPLAVLPVAGVVGDVGPLGQQGEVGGPALAGGLSEPASEVSTESIAGDRQEPSAERPAGRVVREPVGGRRDRGEHLLDQVGGVGVLEPMTPAIGED